LDGARALVEQIRDTDLVEKVTAAKGAFGYEYIHKSCVDEQRRRDKLNALPRDQRRRATTRQVLEEEGGADRDNLRHLHSALAICSLPLKKTEQREWHRNQGRSRLTITAGKLLTPEGEWEDQPLPYGSRARLLLIHTCSEAIRQKSATIEIDDTLTGFIRSMGFPVTGGKNGTLTSFKQQINALAACNMRIGMFDGDRSRTINTQPFSEINLWLPSTPDQRSLWPSTVTFSQEFYQTLTRHALPMNVHAIRAFANSPRKLDLLFWLGYRIHSLKKATPISWQALKDQFGADYKRDRRFRSDLADEIDEIKEVFPKLPVTVTEAGFTIQPAGPEVLSIPAISRK
jgi:hypothetical protein